MHARTDVHARTRRCACADARRVANAHARTHARTQRQTTRKHAHASAHARAHPPTHTRAQHTWHKQTKAIACAHQHAPLSPRMLHVFIHAPLNV
eukprot:183279-Alexandrium_andersonii.AAC.1